ncbi:carbohydrate-binding module family 1 protein [Sodiomyces alcalophilus JCM 7366]|uniref:carbohydrate-binding module family 1 protein n=1 Tax=Sodiomyces alcalophilus JCM 7366 TaxID=591952 RepID=UPI0039B421EB
MVSFTALITALTAVSGALAAPSLEKRQVTPNQEGTHDGYFFSWWSDGASPVTYTNLAGGSYSVQWQRGGNLVGGKGWNPGSRRSITYQADFNPVNNGNSYLTVYGWTRNPLVEYYIIERHGEYNPGSQAQARGQVTHAGSTYRLYESTRHQQPSIDGTQTFQQYWAIRDQQRTSGTVDTGVFFDAWAAAGMPLGNHYYMVMATEAYNSAGNSRVTIGGSGGSPPPTNPPPSNPPPSSGCSAIWGQCGGMGWNGPQCCSQGTCQQQNPWYSQCL